MPSTEIDFGEYAAVAWHPHHLEHLLPLCEVLGAPVIVPGRSLASIARTAYPNPKIIEIDDVDVEGEKLLFSPAIQEALAPYRVILYSHLLSRKELRFVFGRQRHDPPRVVFCPHGFSEKRQTWSSIAAYQDISLFYGDFGLEQLTNWGVRDQLERYVVVGDYRRSYHGRHQSFFRELLSQKGLDVDKRFKSRVLYAPTWQDFLGSSSFRDAMGPLIDNLPDDWQLIIKPHPLLETKISGRFDELFSRRENIVLLRGVPLTIPVLEEIEAYVGDMSSLAYDCLPYDLPMVFLNQTANDVGDAKGSELFACGTVVDPGSYSEIYRCILREQEMPFKRMERRRQLYRRVYASERCEGSLVQELTDITQGKGPDWMCA